MPRNRKVFSKYFTADNTDHNRNIAEVLHKKRKNNFYAYIEETVKQKQRSIQDLVDNLVSNIPIDPSNDKEFSNIHIKKSEYINNFTETKYSQSANMKSNRFTQNSFNPQYYTMPVNLNNSRGKPNALNYTNLLRICDNSTLRENIYEDCISNNHKKINIISNIKLGLRSVKNNEYRLPQSKPYINNKNVRMENEALNIRSIDNIAVTISKNKENLYKLGKRVRFTEPAVVDLTEQILSNLELVEIHDNQNIKKKINSSLNILRSAECLKENNYTVSLGTRATPITMSSMTTNKHFPQNVQPSCSKDHYYNPDDVMGVDELPSSSRRSTKNALIDNFSKQNSKLEKQTSLSEPIFIDLTQEVPENVKQSKVNSSNSNKDNIFIDLTQDENESQVNINDGWLNKRHRMVFTCHFCRQKFADKKDFRHHLYEHKEFQCHYCLKEFGRTNDLSRHLNKSHT